MDLEKLELNVQEFCNAKHVTPTVAFRESGIGKNFFDNIRRGSAPSIEKVQKLAQYLGCTTSELLGETSPIHWPSPVSACLDPESMNVAAAYQQADERSRAMVRLALGLDDDTAIAARGGRVVKKPSPTSAETLVKLSAATREAAEEENDAGI